MILDAAAIAGRMVDPPADLRAYLLGFYPQAEIPLMEQIAPDAEPLVARIVHGIWTASCPCGAPAQPGLPAPGCIVWLDVPLGWDVRCQNRATEGRWRPIALPFPDERRQIEAVLDCRPDILSRNWAPGETIADLLAENVAHGCSVPDLEVA